MPKLIEDNKTDDMIVAEIAKHREAGTTVSRITIGGGLYLEDPLTRAIWRMVFTTLAGKRNKLTFGKYSPAKRGNNVTAARLLRDEALAKLAKKVDPAAERNEEAQAIKAGKTLDEINAKRRANKESALLSFQHIAELFIAECRGHMAKKTCDAMETRAAKHVYKHIGSTHIAKVTKAQALVITTLLKPTGKFDTLRKVRLFVKDVYDFATSKYLELGLPEDLQCPVVHDKFLFINQPTEVHRLAVIDETKKFNTEAARTEQTERIRALAVDIVNSPKGLDENPNKGLQLMLWTGQRTINVAEARKADFDLDAGRWVIPFTEMKGSTVAKRNGEIKDQVVMLATQAVSMLRAHFAAYPDSQWVFPGKPKGMLGKGGIVLTGLPMNEKAMNKRLHHLGYKGIQTGHGLRAIVKTAGHRLAGCDPVVLEATLAHKAAMKHIEDGGMRGVYSRDIDDGIDPAVHQREAQLWADWLEGVLAAPADAAPQKPVLTLVATQAPAEQLKAA